MEAPYQALFCFLVNPLGTCRAILDVFFQQWPEDGEAHLGFGEGEGAWVLGEGNQLVLDPQQNSEMFYSQVREW